MWIRRMTGRAMVRRAEGETGELGFNIARVIINVRYR